MDAHDLPPLCDCLSVWAVQLEVVPVSEAAKPPVSAKPEAAAAPTAASLLRKPAAAGGVRSSSASSSSLFAVASVVRVNPNNSRAQLRKQLQEQARHQGASWLARELGYKDFREHQRDLKIMELKRKAMASRLKQQLEEQKKKEEGSRRVGSDEIFDDEDEDGSDSDYNGEEVRCFLCCRPMIASTSTPQA